MAYQRLNSECVRVSREGEYATVFIREWSRAPEAVGFGGELVIHSSFGTMGYTWTHVARPFKEFLSDISQESLVGKLFGEAAMVYDGDASYKAVAEHLESLKQKGDIAEDVMQELQAVWACLEEVILFSEGGFWHAIGELDSSPDEVTLDLSEEGSWLLKKRQNDQATGLMEVLWPEIRASLLGVDEVASVE